jgi:hypothetical protein
MDIRNLLNYLEEQVTAYTPNVDNVIEDQLQERSRLQVEVNDDKADDSQELPVVSAAEAYKMVEMLERSGCSKMTRVFHSLPPHRR